VLNMRVLLIKFCALCFLTLSVLAETPTLAWSEVGSEVTPVPTEVSSLSQNEIENDTAPVPAEVSTLPQNEIENGTAPVPAEVSTLPQNEIENGTAPMPAEVSTLPQNKVQSTAASAPSKAPTLPQNKVANEASPAPSKSSPKKPVRKSTSSNTSNKMISDDVLYEGSPHRIKKLLLNFNRRANSIRTMTSDFVQIDQNGMRSHGVFYFLKPNKFKFMYKNPSDTEIVSDGVDLIIHDLKEASRELYPLSQTPLQHLLTEKIDLANNPSIVNVIVTKTSIVVTFDQDTSFGSGYLTVTFNKATGEISRWLVRDAQNQTTLLIIKDAVINKPIDASHFVIDRLFDLHNTN